MSGDDNYTDKFLRAAQKVKQLLSHNGELKVITPLDIESAYLDVVQSETLTQQQKYNRLLAEDMKILASCDTIYVLRDWMNSPGAIAEIAFAEACNLNIIFD